MKSFRTLWSRVFLAGTFAAVTAATGDAGAAPKQSWFQLMTGNGYGFQIFDASKNKITSFFDHPYNYTGPRSDPKADGYPHRNLAYDVYFGIKAPGGSGWLNAPTQPGKPEYTAESNIIHAPATLGGVTVDSYFFSPFGFEGNMMVALLHAPGASDGYALLNFHLGTTDGGSHDPDAVGESLSAIAAQQAISETGPGGGAMVYVPLSGVDHADCQNVHTKGAAGQDLGSNQTCSGNDVVPGFQKKLDANGWMAVGIGFVENAGDAATMAQRIADWGASRAPDKILADAQAEWEAWRKPTYCADQYAKVWRQAEATLRMGQVREPYTAARRSEGMLLAALPPGNWAMGWVRDGTYATVALARSGHTAEAKASLDFFLGASPVGKYKSYVSNVDYRISVVRYFGNGEEEADYSGQSTPNVEIDGWGMVLWAARQYLEASGDTAWFSSNTRLGPKVYDTLINGIAKPLEANMEATGIIKKDSGIWEVHDANKRHFAFTTMSAARGFCDLAAIAKKTGNAADATHYAQLAKKVKTAFFQNFIDQQGALGGSTEGIAANQYYDGAVAAAFTWNLMDEPKGQTANATIDVLHQLKVGTGGYKRNNDGLSSYDNNEWILVDLLIANALRRNGHESEADLLIKQQVVDKAAMNYNLIPELYDAVNGTGDYAGAVPMVGYGAGAYMMTILDRAGIVEPNDCGDGVGVTLPQGPCSTPSTSSSSSGGGSSTTSGGTGGYVGTGGSGGGVVGPYGTGACLCEAGMGGERAPWGLLAAGGIFSLLALRRRGQKSRA